MIWPWCDPAPPEPAYVPPAWLPYYYDHTHLARSGLTASLGIFRILWAALKHRHEAVGLAFSLPDPGRVRSTTVARALLDDYTTSMTALLASGLYVGECGEPVTGPIPAASWPESVPDFIALFPRLRYRLQVVLEVSEAVPIASTVRKDSIIGSWTVPRYLGCSRVRAVTLENASPGVSLRPAVHCGAFGPVQARYLRTIPFHTPVEPPKTVSGGGSGPSAFTFDLTGLSTIPPNGYEESPPPPNCEYRYLLYGSWSHAEVILNGHYFYFDGPGPHEVTNALAAENVVTVRPWNGTPVWSALTLREICQWRGSLPAPASTSLRFRELEWFGEKPWGNWGGTQAVSFRLRGAVEAFRYGPFAPPLVEAFLPPSLNVWPRHLDPGMVCHAGFNPPSTTDYTYDALFRQASGVQTLPSGNVAAEINWLHFSPQNVDPTGRVEVTAGGVMLAGTTIGPRARICEILSYEPNQDEEQAGVIFNGTAKLVARRFSPDRVWPGSAFTLYTRVRVADGEVFRFGNLLLTISGGIPSLNGLTGPPLTPGRLADLAAVYAGGTLTLVVNGAAGASGSLNVTVATAVTFGDAYQGRMYRAILFNSALDLGAIRELAAHGSPDSRWSGIAFDLDLHTGTGLHFPDRSTNLSGADGILGLTHIFPASYGARSVVRRVLSDNGPVLMETLVRNQAPRRIEFEILETFTPGTTFSLGTTASPALYGTYSGTTIGFHTGSLSTNSVYGPTGVFLTVTGATAGQALVRFVYEVRGLPTDGPGPPPDPEPEGLEIDLRMSDITILDQEGSEVLGDSNLTDGQNNSLAMNWDYASTIAKPTFNGTYLTGLLKGYKTLLGSTTGVCPPDANYWFWAKFRLANAMPPGSASGVINFGVANAGGEYMIVQVSAAPDNGACTANFFAITAGGFVIGTPVTLTAGADVELGIYIERTDTGHDIQTTVNGLTVSFASAAYAPMIPETMILPMDGLVIEPPPPEVTDLAFDFHRYRFTTTEVPEIATT